MRALRMLFFVGLVFNFVCSSLSYAAVPQMINYQGKITTPTGALVDTTVQMIFTIYDDSTTGNVMWADTVSSVSVQKGIFSVLLGSNNPIPDTVFDGNARYLGTKVGSDAEMSPRKAMVSVAYAYRAGAADGGGGASCGWVDDGTVIRLETQTDSVGIGTTTPGYKLHLQGTSTPPNPLVYVDQTGTGRGLWVNTVGGACAFVAEAGNHGLRVIDAGGDGIHVENAGGWAGYFDGTGYFSGNLGIGTTSPGANLDIVSANPNLRVGTSSGSPVITLDKASGNWGYLEFRDNGASKWQAGVTTDNNYYILNWPASRYVFYANSAGEVGIGTTSPDERLHVVGNIKMVDGNQAAGYVLTSDANGVGTWQAASGGIGGSGTTNYLSKFTASTTLGNSVFYESGGRIGLGTTSPGADLDIVSANPNLRVGTTSGTPVITLDKASGNWGYLEFREGGASKWQAGVTTDNNYYILNWPASKYVFYANSAGNVGIGTTSPDEELHVVGNIKMVDGNQAAGYVLTSDANGVGTWQATTSGGGWVDDGAVVRLETSTDNVGIGTASPGANLDIVSTNPSLRLGTASGSPVITLDKAAGNWGYLEFRESGASKWQAGVTTGNSYYILNWPSSKYVFYANSAGDVGIGTTSPSEKLTVNGDIDMIQGQSRIHGTGEISFDWSAGSTYDNPSQHGIESKDESGSWGDEIRINSMNDIINTVDANDNIATSYFKVQHHSTGDGEDLFWVRSSDGYAYHKGRLGIGTTSPGVDLDILSTNPNLRLSTTSGSPVITLDKASGYWGYLEFRDGGASKWQAGVTSGNEYYILNWPASRYVFYANSAGNVGMGTTSPTGPLDVNGNDIRIRTSQTPASSSADGYTGEVAWDSNYIYICVSGDGPGGGTDSWKRAALSTW